MTYINNNNQTESISAKWYGASETGQMIEISKLESFSSSNKFYIIFEGKRNIKKICPKSSSVTG